MKIRVQRIEDGPARVEVIDPSDGALAKSVDVNVGEEVTVVATTANSPADIEVGEVVETAEQGENPESTEDGGEDGEQAAEDTAAGVRGGTAQPSASAPGGEESTDPGPTAA
jgi:hypothetical protein